jgi:hypothetical protein
MRARSTKAKPVAPEETPTELPFELVAARAYEIHESGSGGDATENWLRAEHELRMSKDVSAAA